MKEANLITNKVRGTLSENMNKENIYSEAKNKSIISEINREKEDAIPDYYETNEWIDLSYEELPKELKNVLKAKNDYYTGLWAEAGDLVGKNSASTEAYLSLSNNSDKIVQSLINNEYFATDEMFKSPYFESQEKLKNLDSRQEIKGEQVLEYGDFIKNRLESFIKDDDVDNAKELLNDYLGLIKGAKVFTRPGIDSVADLTKDYFLNTFYNEESSAKNLLKKLSDPEDADFKGEFKYLVDTNLKHNSFAEKFNEIISVVGKDEREKMINYYEQVYENTQNNVKNLSEICSNICTSNNFVELKNKKEENLPIEIQVILSENPEARRLFNDLKISDGEIKFVEKTATEQKVLEALQNIGVNANANFQTNWMDELIVEGKDISLTQGTDKKKEVLKISDEISRLKKEARDKSTEEFKVEDGFLKKIFFARDKEAFENKRKAKVLSIEKEINDLESQIESYGVGNLNQDAELVKLAANSYKRLEALRPNLLSIEERNALDEFNEKYLSPINKNYAAKKMQFDISNEQTKSAQDILKTLAVLGPIANFFEGAGLGEIGKLVAGTGDDIGGEIGEIKSQKGQGFTLEQIVMQRWKGLSTSLGVATLLSVSAEKLSKSGLPVLGGVSMGLGATLLSATSVFMSMSMFKQSFDQCQKEGKVGGFKYLSTNENFKKQWSEYFKDNKPASKEEMVKAISSIFDKLEENDKLGLRAKEVPFNNDQELEMLSELSSYDENTLKEIIISTPDKNFQSKILSGKISAKEFISLSPEFKKEWKNLYKGFKGVDRDILLSRISSTIKSMRMNDELNKEMPIDKSVRDDILNKVSEEADLDKVISMIEKNGNLQAWKQAFVQDFNHPARAGIALGVPTAMLLGGTAGAFNYLHNGFLNTAIGGAETYSGLAACLIAKQRLNLKWQNEMKKRLNKVKESNAELEEGVVVKQKIKYAS